ncbi:hypothetical protein HanIR_Chr10g0455221 [Helianthus annuus]|nr:hypothetical protein HanIR_Chr10g0455221 [Helianthus annuus]
MHDTLKTLDFTLNLQLINIIYHQSYTYPPPSCLRPQGVPHLKSSQDFTKSPLIFLGLIKIM